MAVGLSFFVHSIFERQEIKGYKFMGFWVFIIKVVFVGGVPLICDAFSQHPFPHMCHVMFKQTDTSYLSRTRSNKNPFNNIGSKKHQKDYENRAQKPAETLDNNVK